MSTIDEIMHGGGYTDRRGRVWTRDAPCGRSFTPIWFCVDNRGFQYYEGDGEMRVLIERDQHRDACPGLNLCTRHPVPRVLIRFRWSTDIYFISIGPGYRSGATHDTLAEAMDGGYELAVNS